VGGRAAAAGDNHFGRGERRCDFDPSPRATFGAMGRGGGGSSSPNDSMFSAMGGAEALTGAGATRPPLQVAQDPKF